MELVKRNLHQMCRKSEAVSQVTFDEDFNVPDAKPDVGRMIQKKGCKFSTNRENGTRQVSRKFPEESVRMTWQ